MKEKIDELVEVKKDAAALKAWELHQQVKALTKDQQSRAALAKRVFDYLHRDKGKT